MSTTNVNVIDKSKLYGLEEAVKLAKATQRAKFTETMDISLKLGIDPTKPEQHVKGFADLPNGTGIAKKVLAIVSDKDAEAAKNAGADFVGAEYIDKISGGWMEFDVVVATPDMMARIGKIGKVLGTKGLMPNAKYGTIDKDIASAVKSFKEGRVVFKNDKYGLLNSPVGKSNFGEKELLENVVFFLKKVLSLKPSTSKGQYLRGVSLSLTMGPSVKLDPLTLQRELRS
ncbi:MAG TPA: 50S ribosomal protein L1 [Fusobacteria bacterium]|nr:50S ribosomal protein L1 [Fusobacteriota bacterium]|tara:strand:+ start:6547 stop:7233 length:687 start_codon:yes stop_codon:yes gene_type:complete